MNIGPVQYLLGATGVGLVVAAVGNRNPLDLVREALTGRGEVRPIAFPRTTSGVDTSTLAGIGLASTPARVDTSTLAGVQAASGNRPATALIGQGGHRLSLAAAPAFRAWEAAYGRTIPVTDSLRSYDEQRAQYERNPRRFGNPDNSAHVAGEAVDVNLTALGLNPRGATPREWLNDAGYARLVATARAAGFLNYQIERNSTGGKVAEPWHFSYRTAR